MQKSNAFGCFVTGTDTEIGKTLISSALLYALNQSGVSAVGMKPVASGSQWRDGAWHNDDADRLAAVSGTVVPSALTTPYLFSSPIAPHVAAREENVTMHADHILDCYRQLRGLTQAIVVEGVGGFIVPLADGLDTAELARRLALPVIMVVGIRLGCINHALLTAEAIAARGLTMAGWVANTVDACMPRQKENVESLRTRLAAPLLGHVPRLSAPTPERVVRFLDCSVLPAWPASSAKA